MTTPTNTYKFPQTIGARVDRLAELADRLEDIEAGKKAVQREYDALEANLLETLPKSELDGATGTKAVVRIARTVVPNAEDWEAIYAYVKKNGAWELLQRRLSATACRERWEAGKTIPGIDQFTKVSLRLSKR